MQRTTKECYMSTDRLTTCQSGDCLIDNRLENRCWQVFLRCTLVDQRLDICLRKHTTTGSDRIKSFIILCIFIQARCIRLKQGCHLVNKGTCTAGTDTVHSLFNITAFKINDLGIFSAKLNSNICLRSHLLKRCRHGNNFLHKRNLQMIRKCQSTGSCNYRT